jgi:hypothetical protein
MSTLLDLIRCRKAETTKEQLQYSFGCASETFAAEFDLREKAIEQTTRLFK